MRKYLKYLPTIVVNDYDEAVFPVHWIECRRRKKEWCDNCFLKFYCFTHKFIYGYGGDSEIPYEDAVRIRTDVVSENFACRLDFANILVWKNSSVAKSNANQIYLERFRSQWKGLTKSCGYDIM